MSINLRFTSAIPGGWRIWKENVEAAGVPTRIADARHFAHGREQGLELEQDPHKPNSIKVIGLYKGWFIKHKSHIGFVPDADAEIIARRDFAEFRPRLRSICAVDQPHLTIMVKFDILETVKPRTKKLPKLV